MSGTGFDKATVGAKAGLQIWRIEKLEPVLQDPNTYGSFYAGDCYLVLNTKEELGTRSFDLFYWIGNGSSQDEQGAVAYKAVELDDLLGGRAVQHREVQGHESAAFRALFPKGIRILEGGVESAFRHVDPTAYKPRLLHLKGKRNVRVTQVELKSSSLNEGDVFILDLGLTLYQWNGKQANKYEKFKGLEMMQLIKDKERGGKARCIFLESGQPHPEEEGFWKVLGDKSAVKSAAEGGEDDDHHALQPPELFRISDASGKMEITSVARGKLERSMLDENDVFLLDTGSELFVWIGKGATKEERAKGMQFATQFLEEQKRPSWTPITRVVCGGETPVFKSYFKVWEAPVKITPEEKKAGKPAALPPDVEALHKQVKQAEEKMVDDGTGQVEIWRIENFKQVPLDKSEYGQFYAGDSYIVLYSYQISGKDAWIIYFWQGRDSSLDEKASAALLTVELDKKFGGSPTQVRVVQGKEPEHFLQLFKGRMIVHAGGRPSGFKNKAEAEEGEKNIRLYHIKGTTERNTRAVEVDVKAASLNSGDCFALVVPETVYVWQGRGSNETERATAARIASILQGNRTLTTVEEGSEPDAFWEALGGKGEYVEFTEAAEELKQPRLFHCSENSGAFTVEEVFNFSQEDLIPDDVMILDVYKEVYVWVGRDARREEKENALRLALHYVEKAPDGRSPDTPVFRVEQGYEPPTFTCHFLGWDPKKFADPEAYEKRMKELQAEGVSSPVSRVTTSSIGYADPETNKYTAEQLRKGVPNVDPARKEYYLTDEEFQALFKMDRAAYEKLPLWKRQQAKKAVGLF